jgi:hypothetical protein
MIQRALNSSTINTIVQSALDSRFILINMAGLFAVLSFSLLLYGLESLFIKLLTWRG